MKKQKPKAKTKQTKKKHFLLMLNLISVVNSFDSNMEKTQPTVITDNEK